MDNKKRKINTLNYRIRFMAKRRIGMQKREKEGQAIQGLVLEASAMDTKIKQVNKAPSPEYAQALAELREELISFIIAERAKRDPRFHWVDDSSWPAVTADQSATAP